MKELWIVAVMAIVMLSGCGKAVVSKERIVESSSENPTTETENLVITESEMVTTEIIISESPKTEEELFALAEEFFLGLLDGQEEADFYDHYDGTITVYKNLYGYEGEGCVIAGRSFYGFSSADCIDVVDNTYYFHVKDDWSECFYKIEVMDGYTIIYSGDSKDTCDGVCGQIGDSPETLSEEFAEDQAHVFFEEIGGIYYDEVSDEIIRVQATEPAGFNLYANFEIVGSGFDVLYDTYCIDVVDNSYYFYTNNSYYRIEDKRAEGGIVIYSGASRENCDEICSSFGVY